MMKFDKKWWKLTKNDATSILDGATSGDGLGAVLISRSQPKILRKIQKNCGNISQVSPAFCMYAYNLCNHICNALFLSERLIHQNKDLQEFFLPICYHFLVWFLVLKTGPFSILDPQWGAGGGGLKKGILCIPYSSFRVIWDIVLTAFLCSSNGAISPRVHFFYWSKSR